MMRATDQGASAQAEMLARSGRVTEAVAALTRAIATGDAAAAYTFGNWRMTGDLIRRDLGAARELFARASALGLAEAEPVYLALLANGAGGSGRQWLAALDRLRQRAASDPLARQQSALLDRMALNADGDPATPAIGETLSEAPRLTRFPAFLTAEECAYVIRRAEPLLEPSVVVHPSTGQLVRDPIRTSQAAAFPFIREDPVFHAINRRIAAATGTTYEQGEPVQVLSYEPDQEYKLHSDALPPGANQRVMTFLVYLNDRYQGGETFFPTGEITVRGQPGDALLFHNVDSAGRPDADARHAGLPVRKGRKLLLSKWIRSAPLDLRGPPGRPF